MRFIDGLLCFGLFLLAAFIVRLDLQDLRDFHRQDRRMSTSYDVPVSPRSVVGYDREGHRIDMLPLGFKRLVIFVIHGTKLQADIDFWNRAAEQNRSPEVEFVGVCDDSTCIQDLTQDPGKVHFSSIMFGDYFAMRTLLKADTLGHILILDRQTNRMRSVEYPASSTAFANMMSTVTEKL